MKQSSTAATVDRTVKANVNGFIKPTFEATEETDGWHKGYFGAPWKKPKNVPWKHIKAVFTQTKVTMHNARVIQAEHDGNTASFFDDHGFVLLDMPTEVKDWNQDYSKTDTDITNIYHKEVEAAILNQLFPKGTDISHISQESAVLRRGPKSENPFYALGVHEDYAMGIENFKEASSAYIPDDATNEAFLSEIDKKLADCEVFMVICFWRPINLRGGVLLNNPLCVLDRATVGEHDIVKSHLHGFTPTGKVQPQLMLKHDKEQRWCYYPDMTENEVLVFKQFYYKKSDPNGKFQCCFHSAFKDPREGFFVKQKRQSTEHRVGVYIK